MYQFLLYSSLIYIIRRLGRYSLAYLLIFFEDYKYFHMTKVFRIHRNKKNVKLDPINRLIERSLNLKLRTYKKIQNELMN